MANFQDMPQKDIPRWIAVLAVIATAWINAACTNAMSLAEMDEKAFLIVDGAQNVRRHRFDATYSQLSYTIDLTYPAQAIGEPQREQLKKIGWVRCQSVHPGQAAANRDWVNFIDGTETPERQIHQHLTTWLKGNRMMMISMRYYSTTLDRSPTAKPDNTNQHVDIVFDDDPEGRNSVAELELDCSQ